MTRTTIKSTASNYVELAYDAPVTGERVTREFHCPRRGGHVREGERQVCAELSSMGYTLRVSDERELIGLIRREWSKARRAAAR